MSLAKHLLEEEEDKRRRRNERASCRRWGIEYLDDNYNVPKVIPVSDYPNIIDLVKSNKNTLFDILTYDKDTDTEFDYKSVYYDPEHKHFYYYYYTESGIRTYETIPLKACVYVWPKDIEKYGGVKFTEEDELLLKANRSFDDYKRHRENGKKPYFPLNHKTIFTF